MIIGTAGHIDHGKSALVTALTGRPVDRLVEEQRRGITIELNFAPLELPGLPPVGIIDVPGHEDLVRTMVAGASGIDLVLLVIDLAEGPRPQTEEHLAILEQLRIPVGIPVFTKADLVDGDWADLVVAETMDRLRSSPIRFEEPAIVSAVTRVGIPALAERIEAKVRAWKPPAPGDRFRMPVDRVFSVAGVGTVVTGTTWGGRVAVGDLIRVLPSGREGRVRSVESYGRVVPAAVPATRTALGIAGIDRADVARGDLIVTGPWEPSSALDVEIELLASAPALGPRSRIRVHLGTAEVLARVSVTTAIRPGTIGLARLVMESPIVARSDDRLVIRGFSPVVTIGGGRVLDPLPPKRSRIAAELAGSQPAARLAALVARRPAGVDRDLLPQLAGSSDAASAEAAASSAGLILIGHRFAGPEAIERTARRIEELVRAHHQSAPDEPGLSLETLRQQARSPVEVTDYTLARLEKRGVVKTKGGVVAASGFAAPDPGGADQVARYLEEAGLEIPTIDEIVKATGVASIGLVLRRAVESGRAQAVDRERYASPAALDRFRKTLTELGRQGEITPAILRDRLGLTRKFLIPLLEWADRQGVTRRVGDARVLTQSGR